MIELYTTKFQSISQHLNLLMQIQWMAPKCRELIPGLKTTFCAHPKTRREFHNGEIVCLPMPSVHYQIDGLIYTNNHIFSPCTCSLVHGRREFPILNILGDFFTSKFKGYMFAHEEFSKHFKHDTLSQASNCINMGSAQCLYCGGNIFKHSSGSNLVAIENFPSVCINFWLSSTVRRESQCT